MGVRDFGAVCDVSVLVDRRNIERARELFGSGSLYLPSSTYGWLSRDKLISVRQQAVGYSLVSQYVRDRKIYAVHLPELYDELARRLMFEAERQIPLTDLRALLLAAHMRLPLLAFSDGIVERLEEHIGTRVLWELETRANSLTTREILELYREFLSDIGSGLYRSIDNGGSFEGPIEEVQRCYKDKLSTTTKAVEQISRGQRNPSVLSFRYLAWDLLPVAREYLEQHVLQPEVIRGLCERALLLVATPVRGRSNNYPS